MRVVIAEWSVRDAAGADWTAKILGPSDSAPADPVERMEHRVLLQLEKPNDPEHEWYGADPLTFPLAAASGALTRLFVRLMTEALDGR